MKMDPVLPVKEENPDTNQICDVFVQEVRKTVRECFIIAVYKGKQITVVEARKLEQKK